MGAIDLDAARAARADKKAESHSLRFGGEDFPLPGAADLPLEVVSAAVQGDPIAFLRTLLGDQVERFMSHHPTVSDLEALTEGLAPLYGFRNFPESSASNGSSLSNGTRSRRTSSASTRSISPKRSGAAKG